MHMEESVNAERGQVLIIMVFGMIVLLIVAGLAIDGGTVFMERRHAQNAADAAALAGTRMLATAICDQSAADDAAILAEVVDFVAKNRVDDPANSVRADYVRYVSGIAQVLGQVGGGTIPVGSTGISATVAITRQTYFMTLVGIDTAGASAHAMALTGPPYTVSGLRPFGVPEEFVTGLSPYDDIWISFKRDGGDIWMTDTITPAQHRGWMNMGYVWNSGENPSFPRTQKIAGDNCTGESASANCLSRWMSEGAPVNIFPDGLWRSGARDGDFVHAKPGTNSSAICDAPLNVAFTIPVFDMVPDCPTEIDTPKPDPCPHQGSGFAYHIVGILGVKITDCDQGGGTLHLEITPATIGQGMPNLGGGLGYGEAHACDMYVQVVTLWE
jgi:hypothetical protein